MSIFALFFAAACAPTTDSSHVTEAEVQKPQSTGTMPPMLDLNSAQCPNAGDKFVMYAGCAPAGVVTSEQAAKLMKAIQIQPQDRSIRSGGI